MIDIKLFEKCKTYQNSMRIPLHFAGQTLVCR